MVDALFEGAGKDKDNSRAKKSRTTKQAENDVIWDALAEIFFPTGIGPDDKSRLGKVVKNLKAHKATPDEIKRRAANFPHVFRNIDAGCTLEGLSRQWDKLGERRMYVPGKGKDQLIREADEAANKVKLKEQAAERAKALEWYSARKESDSSIVEIGDAILASANHFEKSFYRKNPMQFALDVYRKWLEVNG